jgi:hypothetical protein
VKRIVANFDSDPANEMAVLIIYSTGICTMCVNRTVFGILDRQNGKVTLSWRSEEGFDNGGADIRASKIVKAGRFSELTCVFDTHPLGDSYQRMKIIRWTGKQFNKIWSHDLEGYGTGARGGEPHDYLARVEFAEEKKAKRIRVTSLYTTRPYEGEQRYQYKHEEVFVWSETAHVYEPVQQGQVSYYQGHSCESNRKMTPEEIRYCN